MPPENKPTEWEGTQPSPYGEPQSGGPKEFFNPDSVSKTPEVPAPAPALGDQLGERKESADLSPKAPDAQPLQRKLPNPVELAREKGKQIQGKAESAKAALTGDPTELIKQKLQERFGDSGLGKTAQKLTGAAQNALQAGRLLAGDMTQLVPFLKKHFKVLLAVALLIAAPLIFLGLSALSSMRRPGEAPGGMGGTSGMLSGTYCKEMQQTLSRNGKNLILPGTEGGFSEESPVNQDGYVVNATIKNFTASAGTAFVGPADPSLGEKYLQIRGKVNTIAMWPFFKTNPQSFWPYYITARWAYYGWGWEKRGPIATPFTMSDYANVRVIIYNPATNKAALAIIGEAGPGAHEAIQTAISRSGKQTTLAQQRALWGSGLHAINPPGAVTILAGGPYPRRLVGESLETALGLTPNDGQGRPIKIGFAPESLQNADPGPIDCSIITTASASTSAPGSAAVPPTKQGGSSQCGIASVISVVRHYNPSFNNPELYNAETQTTNPEAESKQCVSEMFINNNTAGKATDFVRATLKSGRRHVTFDDVAKSVTAGDPVIIYTSPDALYPATQKYDQHIFVITGYNQEDKTFNVMSPRLKGFDLFNGKFNSSRTGKEEKITAEFLESYTSKVSSSYAHGHEFIMREKYVPTQ